ncbi:MAG: ankyrin repeat domain-containing protein [Rickettsiales bacterium]|nr:ankyrin repeat domain-containing protein [Rickettsiales bacterium]
MPVVEDFFVAASNFREIEELQQKLRDVVSAGFDANVSDDFGETALMLAAKNNQKDVVEFLLENGADPFLKAGNDYAAIHYAANNGHLEIVKLFAQNSPEILELAGPEGWNPLHFAASCGYAEIVKFLILQTVDTSKTTESGHKALDLAGSEEVSDWLKSQETDLGVRNVLQKSVSCSALSAQRLAGVSLTLGRESF